MAKEFLTDDQVELEIERLLQSPEVKLAKEEQRIKMRRRQYMYQLRWLEKRGRELETEGMTIEKLRAMDVEVDDGDE